MPTSTATRLGHPASIAFGGPHSHFPRSSPRSGIGLSPIREVEEITFTNPTNNEYPIFFAVAGNADTGEAGGYTVEMELGVRANPSVKSSGESISSWPSSVTTLTVDGDGNASASGNLSTGSCVNLDFASSSQVACFPATKIKPGESRVLCVEGSTATQVLN